MNIVFGITNGFNATLAPFKNIKFISIINHILFIGLANIFRTNQNFIPDDIFAILT